MDNEVYDSASHILKVTKDIRSNMEDGQVTVSKGPGFESRVSHGPFRRLSIGLTFHLVKNKPCLE
jgi:hypothetical protein